MDSLTVLLLFCCCRGFKPLLDGISTGFQRLFSPSKPASPCVYNLVSSDEEDDFNFAERFATLKAEFEQQLQEEATLNQVILDNLAKVKV